ncbi:hypothetical protein RI367_001068 [Sorochytrium milnesiophthora]
MAQQQQQQRQRQQPAPRSIVAKKTYTVSVALKEFVGVRVLRSGDYEFRVRCSGANKSGAPVELLHQYGKSASEALVSRCQGARRAIDIERAVHTLDSTYDITVCLEQLHCPKRPDPLIDFDVQLWFTDDVDNVTLLLQERRLVLALVDAQCAAGDVTAHVLLNSSICYGQLALRFSIACQSVSLQRRESVISNLCRTLVEPWSYCCDLQSVVSTSDTLAAVALCSGFVQQAVSVLAQHWCEQQRHQLSCTLRLLGCYSEVCQSLSDMLFALAHDSGDPLRTLNHLLLELSGLTHGQSPPHSTAASDAAGLQALSCIAKSVRTHHTVHVLPSTAEQCRYAGMTTYDLHTGNLVSEASTSSTEQRQQDLIVFIHGYHGTSSDLRPFCNVLFTTLYNQRHDLDQVPFALFVSLPPDQMELGLDQLSAHVMGEVDAFAQTHDVGAIRLARSEGLHAFREIHVVASAQDEYVPLYSTRIDCTALPPGIAGQEPGIVLQEMADLIRSRIPPTVIARKHCATFDSPQHSWTFDGWTGKCFHTALLEHSTFIADFLARTGCLQ